MLVCVLKNLPTNMGEREGFKVLIFGGVVTYIWIIGCTFKANACFKLLQVEAPLGWMVYGVCIQTPRQLSKTHILRFIPSHNSDPPGVLSCGFSVSDSGAREVLYSVPLLHLCLCVSVKLITKSAFVLHLFELKLTRQESNTKQEMFWNSQTLEAHLNFNKLYAVI